MRMPPDEVQQFNRLSANDKLLRNVVTVQGPHATEYYRLRIDGCFVLDRRYLQPVASEARFYSECLSWRDLTDWVE